MERLKSVNIFNQFREQVIQVIEGLAADNVLAGGFDLSRVSVDVPRDAAFGDLSTNAAMVLAKAAGMKPRDLAAALTERLAAADGVISAEIAGPGFINIRLDQSIWHHCLAEILQTGTAYGGSDVGGGELVNVEFVSANPTGPLHIGHARGSVFGDVLAALLQKAGFAVTREYYINDAGSQVDVLARSAHLRYREALGDDIGTIPEGLYPGDYLRPVGAALAAQEGDRLRELPESEWLPEIRRFVIDAMMDLVREDLAALGIRHDIFTSERELVEASKVEAVLDDLSQRGLIYTGVLEPPKGKKPDDWEPRPQTLFRATEYGDDVDRPIKKSDGSWTYFTNDIANHFDKYRRGFNIQIDIFGADHGGYVKRMKAATTAISDGEADLDIKLCQLVHLIKGGQPMRMSKRAGNFVTLRDLIDEVGKDVVRFIMLTRKNDSQMEFDLEKALEQSRDNPVFYVQYAHARCHSVLRNALEGLSAEDITCENLRNADLDRLNDPAELDIVRIMANWPRFVQSAAEAHEPHRIAYYLNDLATGFHALWNKGKDDARLRFIHDDDRELTLARLALVQADAFVSASGLAVFGVAPVEELR